MASTAERRATYQDVLNAPDDVVAELLGGMLYTHARPAGPHTEAASVLVMDIGSAFHRGRGGPGGWFILVKPELHLGDDVVVPDLAGWRRERLGAVPKTPAITVHPDWVCEVLSPSTALVDRRVKLKLYAREQVSHVWLLDPVVRSLEVYRLDGDGYRAVGTWGDTDVARLEPFAAIELELAALWPGSDLPSDLPSDPPSGG